MSWNECWLMEWFQAFLTYRLKILLHERNYILEELLKADIEINSGGLIQMLRLTEHKPTEVNSRKAPIQFGGKFALKVVVVRHLTIKDRWGFKQLRNAVDNAIDSTVPPSGSTPHLQIPASLIMWIRVENFTSQRWHSLWRSICPIDCGEIIPENGVGHQTSRHGQLEEFSMLLRSSRHLQELWFQLISEDMSRTSRLDPFPVPSNHETEFLEGGILQPLIKIRHTPRASKTAEWLRDNWCLAKWKWDHFLI